MKKIFGLIVVLVFSFWTVRPLFSSGYFPIHDDTQIERVVVMGRALRQGQFPVRWVSDLGYGYGYPIFNFYGPLPYYVGGFLYSLGFSGLVATKIMMGLGLVLAGVTMYLALADTIGVAGGLLGSVFYLFAPYHAVDAYVRGAVGEYWALVFLPLILWGAARIIQKKSMKSGILLGSAGLAGLIVSHTILGYAGMVFVAVFVLVAFISYRRGYLHWEQFKNILFLVFLGLGLSAFFWLPALGEMRYTDVAGQISKTADFRDHFVCLAQLWSAPWGFGGSVKGCMDGLSLKVGKVHIILALVVLAGWLLGFIRDKLGKLLAGAGLTITFLALFFTLPISLFAWELLPMFQYIQYPWRFLAFAAFGISVTGSLFVYAVRWKLLRWAGVIVFLGILLFVEAKRFMPQYMYSRPAAEFETETDIRWRASKISDEYLPPDVRRPANPSEIVHAIIAQSDLYQVEIRQQTNTYVQLGFFTNMQTNITLNTAYFPGWRYLVNGKDTVPSLENGLPVLSIPQGQSTVELLFRDTPVRTLGNTLSLLSLGICFYLYDRRKKANA